MYNEECLREINDFFEKLDARRDNLPSELAIFNLLETFSYDRSVIGNILDIDYKNLVNSIFYRSQSNPDFTNRKTVREVRTEVELVDKTRRDDYTPKYKPVKYVSAIVTTEVHKGMAYDDLIWLHFSVVPESVIDVVEAVTDILNKNGISHYIKISEVIGPDAIMVGVCNKTGARVLLDACQNNPTIQDNITLNNPFMPHCNGIGIIKETQNRSYTRHISSLIYDYASTTRDTKLTFSGFCRFVNKLFTESLNNRTYQERQLDYQAILGCFSIYKKQDYLSHLIHLPSITYEKEEFDKYQVTFENGQYCYVDRDDNEITSANFTKWLKLQAYNCIQRMHYEQRGELPKGDISLGEGMTGFMSHLIDSIMCEESFQVPNNYRDLMINDLYPYLVGYFAYEAKMTTEEEIKKVISKVSARMIKKIPIDGTNKNFYQIGDKTIQSTIPPIHVDNMLVGIEYLDYEFNYCNVFIHQGDSVKGHLGIFLDLEKDKIWEENDVISSTYRASVARLLSRYDSLEKEHITRGPLEGLLVHLTPDEYTPVEVNDNPPKMMA